MMTSRRLKRRQRHGEENIDRWMVSYADFITLLFAFFVVMYAISTVNEGKYRVLSETLRTNFGSATPHDRAAALSSSPLNVETDVAGNAVIPLPLPATASAAEAADDSVNEAMFAPLDPLSRVERKLRGMVGGLIEDGKVALRRTERGLELEINSSLLFASASSTLHERYRPLLVRVARVLRDQPGAVDVEGFTDDQPIYTERFPSNWELSAARAVAVIRLFEDHGVEPGRLAAIGYGEHRPVASNETPIGRAKNRRVVLVIRDTERILPTMAGGK